MILLMSVLLALFVSAAQMGVVLPTQILPLPLPLLHLKLQLTRSPVALPPTRRLTILQKQNSTSPLESPNQLT